MFNKTLLLVTVSISLCADIQEQLEDFYKKCGSVVNTSSSDVYQGQKAGYYTGGSLTVRNQVMDSKLIGVTLPNINAGCGGIDIYTGGFSFISSNELIKTLKSIGSNAAGYAFMLAMETVSPLVSNNISKLQSWANMANGIGINSCEAAATLVGAVVPKHHIASEHICNTIGTQFGGISDSVAARHQCNVPSERSKIQQIQKDNVPNILDQEYNLAWEAIRKLEFLASDSAQAELFMSLIGSLIRRGEGDPKVYATETLRSKIDDEGFLHTLLKGGEMKVYKCKEDDIQCLWPVEETIKLPQAKSWLSTTQSTLLAIQEKIVNDEELVGKERLLIERSSLPLYKIVNVITAHRKGRSPVELYQYSDIIAMDILCQFLREVVSSAQNSINHLRRAQLFDNEISEFQNQLSSIEEKIGSYETRGRVRMDQEFQLIQKVQLIEEELRAQFRI